MVSLTVFLIVVLVLVIAAMLFVKLFADKAHETGYREGQTDRPHDFIDPLPTDYVQITEREHPYDAYSVIPEFGIHIKYQKNDKEPLKRTFDIESFVGYTNPITKTFKLAPDGMSDGWHTFEELYNYRALYNAGLVNMIAWAKKYTVGPKAFDGIDVIKSKKHFGGEPCYDGEYFVVMIKTPWGQISNHYKLEHWNKFVCRSTKTGWKWDGHTMKESNERLMKLYKYIESNL